MKIKSPNQSGSTLIPAMISVVFVGFLAASMNVLLTANVEDVNERLRQAQGISVADSYRLSLNVGLTLEGSQDALQSKIYPDVEKRFKLNDDLVGGVIVLGNRQYGYLFDDPRPFAGFKTEEDLGVCTTNQEQSNRVKCTWTADTIIDDPIKIDADTEFVIREGTVITFNGPLYVDGDLRIRQNQSAGSQNNVCFREWVEVTGDLNTTSLKIQETDSCENSEFKFNALFLSDLTVGSE